MHANGGATDARGTAVQPIYGPALDGTLPGNEVIVQSRAPTASPMPARWGRCSSCREPGRATPPTATATARPTCRTVYDATLAAARYLCSGGLNLRDPSQVMTAILRYNNSMAYARNVLGWAAAYATGVVPVDLPPITGPVPPAGRHAPGEQPQGLGPGLPLNALGLPPTIRWR